MSGVEWLRVYDKFYDRVFDRAMSPSTMPFGPEDFGRAQSRASRPKGSGQAAVRHQTSTTWHPYLSQSHPPSLSYGGAGREPREIKNIRSENSVTFVLCVRKTFLCIRSRTLRSRAPTALAVGVARSRKAEEEVYLFFRFHGSFCHLERICVHLCPEDFSAFFAALAQSRGSGASGR
jgi:hypothetical protein